MRLVPLIRTDDTFGTGQIGPHDAEIEASPNACP